MVHCSWHQEPGKPRESTHLKHVESPTAAELEATQIDIYPQTTSNLKAPINHRIVDLWNE